MERANLYIETKFTQNITQLAKTNYVREHYFIRKTVPCIMKIVHLICTCKMYQLKAS
ncbi:hypothetical protein Fmac_019831 [Flemingia macrophylla]|uniref:Uncharacterized protein n=1 Tax=Flemingia macrophylla TaxID=520843 RepID=A0ABD1M8W2_9FABA